MTYSPNEPGTEHARRIEAVHTAIQGTNTVERCPTLELLGSDAYEVRTRSYTSYRSTLVRKSDGAEIATSGPAQTADNSLVKLEDELSRMTFYDVLSHKTALEQARERYDC